MAAFWTSLVGAVPPGGALKLSLFSYEKAPVTALLEACANLGVPVWIVAPAGYAAGDFILLKSVEAAGPSWQKNPFALILQDWQFSFSSNP